jgi:hypothetical protein
MNCVNCDSDRILSVLAHCSDTFNANFKGVEYNGYVPGDLGIGDGDDVEVDICLACGMAQGISDHPDPEFYTNEKGEEL